jgi:hypothetical protein
MCRVGKTNAERSEADVCPPAELMAGTAHNAIARSHARSRRLCLPCGLPLTLRVAG